MRKCVAHVFETNCHSIAMRLVLCIFPSIDQRQPKIMKFQAKNILATFAENSNAK